MSNWNFKHRSVEQFTTPESSGQLGSKAVMVSFGPPEYNAKNQCIVCGFVQSFSLMQQRQVQQLFEVGSERQYWVDGPTMSQISLSRVMFSGSSLLKIIGAGILNQGIQPNNLSGLDSSMFTGDNLNAVAAGADRNFWINLASDLFSNSLGIMLDFLEFYGNGKSKSYGSVYLTNGKLNSHQLNFGAGQWMIQEGVSLMFEKVIPLSKDGSTYQDSHAKRKEIMDQNNMTPAWFDQYKTWTGTTSSLEPGSQA